MKEKNLIKIQPLPKVLRVQAIRSKQLRNIYNCYVHAYEHTEFTDLHRAKHTELINIHRANKHT